MLTKEKALYQTKLILDYLPEEEYKLIPKEDIDYIENNFEYDTSIVINPEIPLENQNIDDKTYEILDRIVKKVEGNKNTDAIENSNNAKENNEETNVKMENIKLKELVELLKEENSKIPKVKELLEEYKDALKQKNDEIDKLKKDNENLCKYIKKIPKFIRKIFVKESNIKLLTDGK